MATAGVRTKAPPLTKSGPVIGADWAEALKIAEKKLGDTNLLLDFRDLTSQLAEENIGAVIKVLTTLQEDDKEKRWIYSWRGKKVIVVERLGKILKSVEKYSKIVDTVVQSNPQVSALVWASAWGIMQVCINILC